MIALGIIAVVVSLGALVVAWLSYQSSQRSARAADRSAAAAEESATAADRSAAAAESAEHRARTPLLTISLVGPPDTSDRAIYRIRNDGPAGLDDITIARPRPPDRITYPLAVTGSDAGWADDEISLGPIALLEDAVFTLACGVAPILPEFLVKSECRAGSESWTLTHSLPSPRPPGLSDAEKAERKQILTFALDELEVDLATLHGPNWHTVSLRDEHFELARRLIVEHAPDWIGPVRDARSGIDEFKAWNAGPTDRLQADVTKHVEGLSTLLSAAHTSLRDLRAALDTAQATGVSWRS